MPNEIDQIFSEIRKLVDSSHFSKYQYSHSKGASIMTVPEQRRLAIEVQIRRFIDASPHDQVALREAIDIAFVQCSSYYTLVLLQLYHLKYEMDIFMRMRVLSCIYNRQYPIFSHAQSDEENEIINSILGPGEAERARLRSILYRSSINEHSVIRAALDLLEVEPGNKEAVESIESIVLPKLETRPSSASPYISSLFRRPDTFKNSLGTIYSIVQSIKDGTTE